MGHKAISSRAAAWLRLRGPFILLNGLAAGILLHVWSAGDRVVFEGSSAPFHAGLESGKWALRWLLICLAMSPLNTYLGWRGAIRLRKSAGLWAFAFAIAHFLAWLQTQKSPLFGWWAWLRPPIPEFLLLGLAALIILTLMALTSNRRAMRWLGKRWKQLHRWVYVAGAAIGLHAILATDSSKVIWGRDPDALPELQLYFGLYGALMLLRGERVRAALREGLAALRRWNPLSGPQASS